MALPDDMTLLRTRDFDGLTAAQLAATYDVPVEEVEARFEAMGRPFNTVNQILGQVP